eukprot:CAMPEP_0182447924 /NCGR_PEP_ID=MMETSP1172-20130603/21719_1 /TAXON_ID=708627 /ORGANISM="Timspurckia oligopyrenoides, Strain CCMP3278" /LENGTH=349 /DNA_ID=CAMNT_0024644571 /DNA_START=401 /DNA_END=1450 /DNA_ORIENTATION=-
MVLASGVVQNQIRSNNNSKTHIIQSFHESESPRSIQLYGVHPQTIYDSILYLREHQNIDHIDLNFGCPVRKITSKGGGSAIPAKPRVLRQLVSAAVSAAEGKIPVTSKFRIGLDETLQTYLECGRICEEAGLSAVGLHARTAEQMYSGNADWNAIGALVDALSIPVLGNGDIWRARDGLQMMKETHCAGIIIGRGCLGRPWLFEEIGRAFEGESVDDLEMDEKCSRVSYKNVLRVMVEHTRRSVDWFAHVHGMEEERVIESMRKHFKWYLQGYGMSKRMLGELMRLRNLEEMEACVGRAMELNIDVDWDVVRSPRGKVTQSMKNRVVLPAGFRDNLNDDTLPPISAEGL